MTDDRQPREIALEVNNGSVKLFLLDVPDQGLVHEQSLHGREAEASEDGNVLHSHNVLVLPHGLKGYLDSLSLTEPVVLFFAKCFVGIVVNAIETD